MTLEMNKAIVRQFFEASSAGDIEAMIANWSPNAINHGRFNATAPAQQLPQQLPPSGIDGLRAVFTSLHDAFPDRQWQIEDLLAVEDRVVARLTVSGTRQGVPTIPVEGGLLLKRTSPFGKHYSVAHIHIFRLTDGKIVEHWAARDDLGLLEQIGGLPVPAPQPA